MKKFHFTNIRLTEEGKKVVICAAAGAAVLTLLVFFLLFRVNKVDVVGSTKYTKEEIKEFALKNPLTSHTLLAVWFKSHIDAKDIPFLESFDLEQVDRHTLRVHVNEKKIVGYIVQGTDKLYFDKDGKVVELVLMDEEEITQMESASEELQALKEEAEREEALQKAKEAEEALTGKKSEEDEPEEEGSTSVMQPQETQTLTAQEVDAGNESATEFHAAVTDVPRVIGLDTGNVELGKKIAIEEKSVFNTILGITRIVEKYKILPEMVVFDKDLQITLVYNQGAIHCHLGKDTLLEEKITRVAAILPKLKDETGILHLEDYTIDTTNIIFSKESLYTLKSKVAEVTGSLEKGNSDAGMQQPGVTVELTGEPGITDPTGEAEPGTTGEPGTVDPTGEAEPGTTGTDGLGGDTGDTPQGTQAGEADPEEPDEVSGDLGEGQLDKTTGNSRASAITGENRNLLQGSRSGAE